MKTKLFLKQLMLVMLQCFAFAALDAQLTCSQAFTYTGADQTFTVPPNVHQITVKLWGAGGAGGNFVFNDIGGGGGFATATLNVIPGEQYTIIVGGAGLPGLGPGAYGGGGIKGNGSGGRGGGRSALRNALSAELITAGGGGGGGGGNAEDFNGKGIARGGAGGGLTGGPSYWIPFNGNPGTQTEGGSGGVWSVDNLPHGSQSGSQFVGGSTIAVENGYNGSGGGGYYGGGSGTDIGDGGGGGGSSYIPSGGNTIAGTDDIPGNISDPDYADNVGYGGSKATAGNAGRVVILWGGTFYIDVDADGYGDVSNKIQNCFQLPGYVADSTDCNDNDAAIKPGAAEILGDSIDNNCNGIIDEVSISSNIGNQSWQDPAFWQSAGLNGIPDSTSVINISGSASGNLTINGDVEMKSLIIDSTSSVIVSFGTNTITIYDGELSAKRPGSINARDASLVLKGKATLNTGDKMGNLRIAPGKAPSPRVVLQQDVKVSNDLELSQPVVQLEGGKKIEVERNMISSSEITGDGKISFTGSETSTISAPPGKLQGKLEVSKSAEAKVMLATSVKGEKLSISSGELQLADQQVTAQVVIEGGNITGNGAVKGNVAAKKPAPADGGMRTKSAIRPGNSPGLITIEGNLDMDSTELGFELLGTLPGTEYDQIKVIGEIKIGSDVMLDLTADSIPGFEFIIIDNDDTDAIDGRFEGLPNNGDTLSISGNIFRIYYNGGDGNDASLKMNDPVPVIDQCPEDTIVCQTNNTVEYTVLTNTIPVPDFTYSFSGATYAEAGTSGTGSGSIFNVGITNVVVTATNAYGSAICSFNIEVTNSIWYADVDGDGFGDANNIIEDCSQPTHYLANSDDCDDADASVYPGAPEICDGKDNDCNGIIEDNILNTYYRDVDADGYGNINKPILACTQPVGYVSNNTDCKDNNVNVNPGNVEICGNNIDDNCNGQTDEGCDLISVAPQPASVNEGNKGKIDLTFIISLSAPAITNCSVNYQTIAATATAGTDYISKSGTLSFKKGQSSKTVIVKIIGDKIPEANETFSLELLNPFNVVISQGSATGTIINDDGTSFAKQTLQPKYNDPKNVSNKLVIPTLLQRNQTWNIQGLPALNTIIVIDSKGQTVFKTTNYKNNSSFSNLAVGLYFYEIMLKDKNGKPEIYRGKLMIVP